MNTPEDLIDIEKIIQLRKILVDWENQNYDAFPWRETDNKFHALIAELMLQRTKAEQVLEVYNTFTEKYPTLECVQKANRNHIKEILSPLGLNWRINNIITLVDKIYEKGYVPDEYDELIELPGVGDYIASAYLSFHTEKCLPIIDSNAVRLWGRIFNFPTGPETRRKKWFKELVSKVTPSENCKQFNYAVLDLTRKICKPKPLHSICPIKKMCIYYWKSERE